DRPAFRDHHRDRYADVTDLAIGERLIVQGLLEVTDGNRVGHRFAGEGAEIGRRIHGHHARHRPGRRAIDAYDACMGVTRAHESRMERAGDRQVIEVFAAAGDKLRVLDPADSGTEIANAHQPSPRDARAASSAASTMVSYPVHRQRLPEIASRTSA